MNPKKWQPINGQVVLCDDKQTDKVGAIYLPDNVETGKVIEGTVLATSCFLLEDGRYMEVPIKAGDRVVYAQHAGAGSTVKENGMVYRLARWNEVLAIVAI